MSLTATFSFLVPSNLDPLFKLFGSVVRVCHPTPGDLSKIELPNLPLCENVWRVVFEVRLLAPNCIRLSIPSDPYLAAHEVSGPGHSSCLWQKVATISEHPSPYISKAYPNTSQNKVLRRNGRDRSTDSQYHHPIRGFTETHGTTREQCHRSGRSERRST